MGTLSMDKPGGKTIAFWATVRPALVPIPAFLRKVETHHLVTLIYLGIAYWLIVAPVTGVTAFINDSLHVSPSFMAALFGLCGSMIAMKPSTRRFILCLFPLVFYTISLFIYFASTGLYSAAAIAISIGAIAIAFQMYDDPTKIRNVRFIVAATQVIVGLFALTAPEKGVAMWLSTELQQLGLDFSNYVLLMFAASLGLLWWKSPLAPTLGMMPILAYTLTGIVLATQLPAVGSIVAFADLLFVAMVVSAFYRKLIQAGEL